MAVERIPTTMSVEEYFALEEKNPDTRYEYVDGYVQMMAGGSANHATISGNIFAILKSLLRGSPCRAYNSDMKVSVSEERYFHPDVTVTCDPRDRGTANLIQSPCVVIEALSPSTETRDRGRKLQWYLACPSIKEYLLVDTRSIRIERYRKEQRKWTYDAFEAEVEVEVTTLGIHFPIADAYEDVIFAKEEKMDL